MAGKMQDKPIEKKKAGRRNDQVHFLILHNDEVNSFDYVIESLIEVCGHSSVQAEQCTFIAHYKGECEVKKGKKRYLEPMQINLVKKGLKASIC